MIASAAPEDFRRTIERVAAEPDVDAVVAIFIPPLVTRAADVAAAIRAAGAATAAAGTPLLAVFMAATDAERAELAGDGAVPVYGTPEEAVRALGHVARYAAWRRDGPDDAAGARRRSTPTRSPRCWPARSRRRRLARSAGRRARPGARTASRSWSPARGHGRRGRAPRRRARRAGGRSRPIAPGLVHKADAGGVALGLTRRGRRPRAPRARWPRAVRAAGHEPEGFVVQRMAPPGAELIVGIVGDPDFGPVVACGAGGHAVELLGDVAVRLAPLGRRAAGAMLRSLRTFPLLDGYRGAPRADLRRGRGRAVARLRARRGTSGDRGARLQPAAWPARTARSSSTPASAWPPRVPARPFPALDR